MKNQPIIDYVGRDNRLSHKFTHKIDYLVTNIDCPLKFHTKLILICSNIDFHLKFTHNRFSCAPTSIIFY